nr:unnamed protein product [Callosobruchus analis]
MYLNASNVVNSSTSLQGAELKNLHANTLPLEKRLWRILTKIETWKVRIHTKLYKCWKKRNALLIENCHLWKKAAFNLEKQLDYEKTKGVKSRTSDVKKNQQTVNVLSGSGVGSQRISSEVNPGADPGRGPSGQLPKSGTAEDSYQLTKDNAESYAQLQQWFDESSDDGAIESGSDFENEMDVVTYSEHDTNSEQEGESDSDDSLDNSTSDDTKNIYFLQILSSTFRDQEESQSKLDQKRNVLSCF